MLIPDEIHAVDNVHILLTGPDGEVKVDQTTHNLVVTKGAEAIADQLLASPAIGKPTHMAIGTGTEAAAAGDTKLKTELDRNALAAKTRSGKVVTMKGEWAAGDGTGAITEAGILNASSEGDLYARAVWAVVNKAAEDTLTITWTVTVG